MKMITKCKLLDLSEIDRNAVLEDCKVTEESLLEAVEIINEWLTKQPHLPQNLDPERTIRTFLATKGSLEKTKNNIEMFYSLRTTFSEIFRDRDPRSPAFRQIMKNIAMFPLPRTLDNSRIVLVRALTDDAKTFSSIYYYVLCYMLWDLRMICDFTKDTILIYDVQNFTMGMLAKFTPTLLKKETVLIQQGYSMRIRQVHIINSHSYIDTFLQILRMFASQKIVGRVHLHENMDSLFKFIPKDHLPSDYGGALKSIKEQQADWSEEFENRRDWFLEQQNVKSDESKRIGKSRADEMFGTEGSFRKLEVD